ncbi:MFS transporter [Rhodocyclus purpureus]|uniref:MFS transporter n=1 Tax=Rhodocyclus purpureus TaxID=1067 RepID=UPI00191207AA|nr:MFS transporter [Rhodocyclus purpureus]MBK5914851.1 hypothetical protein [Rhodocyclus purpureus]
MPTSERPAGSSRLIFLLALAAFASSASFRVCDPMLPDLADRFGGTAGQVAMIITGFTVAYGAMQLIYGPLGERFERFRIVTLATLCCALGSVGAALAPNLPTLVACRVLTGICAAGIIPMSMACIASLVPPGERQAALARFFSGQILGMVCGQIVGGLAVDFGVWRIAFALLTLLYLAIAFALWRNAGEVPQQAAAGSQPPSIASLYLAAGRMIGSAPLRGVLLCFFFEAALVFAALAFIPLYLHERFGLSLGQASLALLLYGAGGLLFSFTAARLGPRLNRQRFPVLAACLVAAANAICLFAGDSGWIFAAAFISGFGYYLLHNALLFQTTQRGAQAPSLAMALSISIFFVGQSAGIAAAGWLVDQGRLTTIFALAALGMPLLGLFTGRRVRAVGPS